MDETCKNECYYNRFMLGIVSECERCAGGEERIREMLEDCLLLSE